MSKEIDDTEHLMSSENNRKRLLESIEQANAVSDEHLLFAYMLGFNDELDSMSEKIYANHIVQRAYNIGRSDALIGDDISSIDNQTNEEVISRIRQI